MIYEETVKRYCYEIEKIENYDLAMTDMKHTWHCHHRLEIGKNGEVISRRDLIKHGLYYDRPASELIFLTKSEHSKLHREKTNPHLGHHHSEGSRRRMSEAMKGNKNFLGKHHSEESRRKMGESHKGKPNGRLGKHHSEEARKKMSEARKAYYAKKRMNKATH